MSLFVYSLGPIILFLFRKYREYTWGYFKEQVDLRNRVCIVTGATSGIGKETVKELLKRNATVIMASRDKKKTALVHEEIKSEIKTGDLVHMELDLASLNSVREFAKQVLERFDKIHVLINNAGLGVPYFQTTEDGFEMNIGVNHLGHFLLTQLLLPRIQKSVPSRIVVVSSKLHERGKVDLDAIEHPGPDKFPLQSRNAAYSNSKLANVYFSRELASRLQGTGVDVYSLCPGFCYTNLFRYTKIRWYQYVLFMPVAFFFMRSAYQGCQTILHCAASPGLQGQNGKMFRDCKEYSSPHKFDPDLQKGLWQLSEKLTGAKYA